MNTHFLALHQDTTAQEAIDAVRRSAQTDMVSYTYVVDEHHHLLGVVSLRQLLMCPADTPLRGILNPEVIRVLDTADQEEVAQLVARYDFFAIPVVNAQNQIVGIITVDDVLDVVKEQAEEDLLMLAGVGEGELYSTTIVESARSRMTWLFVSLVGGLAASMVISRFGSLRNFALLVPFVPIINGMGGNVGTQTITLMVRGLATGSYDLSRFWQILLREIMVVAVIASGFSVLVSLYAGLAKGWIIGPIVGFSLLLSMLVSTVVAVSMPMFFERIRVDPAVSSGPFVTTSIDILATMLYFTVASLLLPS